MSKEQYVKSGTAKLLREKGFRGDCIAYYNDDGKRYLSLNAELHPLDWRRDYVPLGNSEENLNETFGA